jgi:small-conductance mechanosensitive channel
MSPLILLADWREDLSRWLRLEYVFYGNPVRQWLIALGVAIAAAVVFRILKALLASRAARLSERSPGAWDDALVEALHKTRWWLLLVLALYFGSLALDLPPRTRGVLQAATIIVLLLQAAVWGRALITFGATRYAQQKMEKDAAAVTTVAALAFIGQLALYAIIALLILDNLGVNITALVAGLGVGGIAVGLAAQNILKDLFASMSIVLDKPFVLGDFIAVGEFMGTVEKIGLKTTRLQGLSGEQLIFSNTDLLQSRIRNHKRMRERRMAFTLSVVYQTPRDKLAAIPGMLRTIIEAQKQTRFDRAHFQALGDSALRFEAVYMMLTPDYNRSLDVQQAINLAILEQFEQQGIKFALPTQTVIVEQGGQP